MGQQQDVCYLQRPEFNYSVSVSDTYCLCFSIFGMMNDDIAPRRGRDLVVNLKEGSISLYTRKSATLAHDGQTHPETAVNYRSEVVVTCIVIQVGRQRVTQPVVQPVTPRVLAHQNNVQARVQIGGAIGSGGV
jgi:hypothetical protein